MSDLPGEDIRSAQAILSAFAQKDYSQGVAILRNLKDEIYASIPHKLRISRGITWVLERASQLLIHECETEEGIFRLGQDLYTQMDKSDVLQGVAIFLMAEYGKGHPSQAFEFFEEIADAEDWVVREVAQGGFRRVIGPNKAVVFPWLRKMATAESPNLRRFASETLRPVVENKWLYREPETSLSVLRLLFREAHPYPRTSVGNNLSDLSRRLPELIFSIVEELVAMGNDNSCWIAYRACRNLVKKQPERVMDILGVDEYHYKDRNFYKSSL